MTAPLEARAAQLEREQDILRGVIRVDALGNTYIRLPESDAPPSEELLGTLYSKADKLFVLRDSLEVEGTIFVDSIKERTTAEGVTFGNVNLNDLTLAGILSLKERAAAAADIDAYGQVWVKTATPNQLWFTSDTGVDVQLGVGGGGGAADIGARVHHAAGPQTVANVTFVDLLFDSERWDTDGIHSVSSNTSRLTAKTKGKYLIWAGIQWDGNAILQRYMSFLVNNVDTIVEQMALGGQGPRQIISTIYELDVDDYVELRVWQNSGTSRTIIVGPKHSPEFAIQLIAAS